MINTAAKKIASSEGNREHKGKKDAVVMVKVGRGLLKRRIARDFSTGLPFIRGTTLKGAQISRLNGCRYFLVVVMLFKFFDESRQKTTAGILKKCLKISKINIVSQKQREPALHVICAFQNGVPGQQAFKVQNLNLFALAAIVLLFFVHFYRNMNDLTFDKTTAFGLSRDSISLRGLQRGFRMATVS